MSGTSDEIQKPMGTRTPVEMGVAAFLALALLGGAFAWVEREVSHSEERQSNRLAAFGAKIDLMRGDLSEIKMAAAVTATKVEAIRDAQKDLQRMADDRWTGRMMKILCDQIRDMNKDKGLVLPDPLKIQRDYAPTNQ